MVLLKTVLALGAGRIARPCIQYLLSYPDYKVILVDTVAENLERVLQGHSRGEGVVGDAVGDAALLISKYKPDVVLCLLPTEFMVATARVCVEAGVSMIATSYVSAQMRELDAPAKQKNISILCEMGVDPGIDHFSAMAMIGRIHERGGEVESFWSVCGALPDLSANTNPFGYKLSWAPESLIGASKRDAHILVDGRVITRLQGETYQHPELVEIESLGCFECYANADSTPYREAYGIPEAKNIFRGTLRYIGWCETVSKMLELRLFETDPQDFTGMTLADMTRRQANLSSSVPLKEGVAAFLKIPSYAAIMGRLEWLGLFSDRPVSPQKGSCRDVIRALYLEKLCFAPGEQDLIAMQHRYTVSFPQEGTRKRYVSTMIARGDVNGDTAIARTTGLPLGIGGHLVLNGSVQTKGILIPTLPEVYIPAMKILTEQGISFCEQESEI